LMALGGHPQYHYKGRRDWPRHGGILATGKRSSKERPEVAHSPESRNDLPRRLGIGAAAPAG